MEPASPIPAGRIEVRCLEELPNSQREQSWKGAVGPGGSLISVQVYDPLLLPSSSSSPPPPKSLWGDSVPDLFMDVGGGLGGHGFLKTPLVSPSAPAIPHHGGSAGGSSSLWSQGCEGPCLGMWARLGVPVWFCVIPCLGAAEALLHSVPIVPGLAIGYDELRAADWAFLRRWGTRVCPSLGRCSPTPAPWLRTPSCLSCLHMATRGLRDQVFLFSPRLELQGFPAAPEH